MLLLLGTSQNHDRPQLPLPPTLRVRCGTPPKCTSQATKRSQTSQTTQTVTLSTALADVSHLQLEQTHTHTPQSPTTNTRTQTRKESAIHANTLDAAHQAARQLLRTSDNTVESRAHQHTNTHRHQHQHQRQRQRQRQTNPIHPSSINECIEHRQQSNAKAAKRQSSKVTKCGWILLWLHHRLTDTQRQQ